jgi:hypothetical protein
MHSIARTGLVFVVAAFAGGCASTAPAGTRPLGWGAARAYDFLDIFELNVQAGTSGPLASIGIWPIGLGLGWYDSMRKAGLEGRAVGSWEESRAETPLLVKRYDKVPRSGNAYLFEPRRFPLSSRDAGVVAERSLAYRFFDVKDEPLTPIWADPEKSWLDLWAEINLFVVGTRVGFRPRELVDFLFGLVGNDAVSEDDWAPEPLAEAAPAPSEP